MGMRIGSSNAAIAAQSSSVSNLQQRQQSVSNLFSALQSGNLSAAQSAFAGLSSKSGSINSNSPLGQIGQALQNGDLTGAQKAAQALQNSRAGHHHHGAEQVASVAPATPLSASGAGSVVNTTA